MFKKHLLTLAGAAFLFGFSLSAADKVVAPTPALQTAIGKLTNGKITRVEEDRSGLTKTFEVKIDAPDRAVEEIEVAQKDFQLIKAEGKSVAGGAFTPGGNLKSLQDLAKALQAHPNFTPEEWELDKKLNGTWVYEVSGTEGGREREYHFDATTLALIKTEDD